MFVDKAKIYIEAGSGGNGSVSFHREKYVAAGGPDGGDGGRGGNIILQADDALYTLMDFRYKRKYKAPNGGDGRGAKSKGKNGEDLIIKVPCGTLVRDVEKDKIIADLTENGETFIAARGGNGGWGNCHFATPTRQTPKFAKPGIKGQSREIQLELKLLADIGLIGFPNVGKSTILSKVSDAQPKIANYHFTTLEPNLGVVKIAPEESFVLADIPGLIEGASEGVGLGHEFLRHIERTRLLIHVVDVSGVEGRDPLEDFERINGELASYSDALLQKKQIVAANKIDLIYDSEQKQRFLKRIEEKGYPLFEISAATGEGVWDMIRYAYQQLKEIPRMPIHEIEQIASEEETTEPFTIRKENETYVVEGPYIERLLGSINFDDHESLQYFQSALRKMGIIDALEAKGIQEGDSVRMDELEFDFVF